MDPINTPANSLAKIEKPHFDITKILGDDPLSRLVASEFKNGEIVKPTCRICCSHLRSQVEQMFEEGKPMSAIKQVFTDAQESLSVANIKTHMAEHYKDAARIERLVDYIYNLNAIRERRLSRKQSLEMSIDIDTLELARIIPIQTNNDIAKESERADMLIKRQRNLKENIEALMEMEGAEEELKAVYHKFMSIWTAKINEAKTPEEKNMYIATLTEFRRLLQNQPEGA